MDSFSAFHWLIAIVIIGVPIYIILRNLGGTKVAFCTTCGHEGPGRNRTRGSLLIEIFLWLLFIIPGVIYSLWRLSTRHPVCASCGAATLVPPGSPVAKKLRAELAKT